MRREFASNKDCTKWWCLRFLGKNGLNELTGSLPVLETWSSQGTDLEQAALGKQRQGLFLAHLMVHLIFLGSEENQIFLYRESLCLCWPGFSENLFLMEISGTCVYLSDELLKTCCQGR